MQSALKNKLSALAQMAIYIWIRTALIFALLLMVGFLLLLPEDDMSWLLALVPGSLVASIPSLVVVFVGTVIITRTLDQYPRRLKSFLLLLAGIVLVHSSGMALLILFLGGRPEEWQLWMALTAALLLSVILGSYLTRKRIYNVLILNQSYQSIMEQQTNSPILFKGIITGVLILLMMIPTLFISSLVQERKARQREIVQEDSKRWAGAQELSGIFLVLPYEQPFKDEKGKETMIRKELVVLPEDLTVGSTMEPVVRTRSIYKVLLYRTDTKFSGHFAIQLPKEILPEQVIWKDASINMGLSDIKGIEEKVVVKLGAQELELSPGLPNKELVKTGLSAPVDLTGLDPAKLPFSTQLKLRGSEQLHFVPLAGNSTYEVKSTWPSPSFDGTSLPAKHLVQDSGFSASWSFSKANLPFGTILREVDLNETDFSFGVSMIQPADHYAKTERSVKYAILFIGLTFSLFFVIELMQKKPVHPVQYVLIGIALSVFYTLLLSVSEFLPFDSAYAIAAIATILLITLYANAHFKSWKTASLFALVLSCLYLFAFILVRLEDTALLVGSIGLFLILALVMYGTRKINWYPAVQVS